MKPSDKSTPLSSLYPASTTTRPRDNPLLPEPDSSKISPAQTLSKSKYKTGWQVNGYSEKKTSNFRI